MSVRVRFAASAGRVAATVALVTVPTFALAASAWSADHKAHADHATMKMSDAEMKQMSDKYWSTHKSVGGVKATDPVTINVTAESAAGNFFFSPPDHTINQGDIVKWNWGAGFHTTTNGTGEADPNAGSLWNGQLDSTHPSFSYQFNTPGEFPYFCVFHESVMRGTITVNPTTDVKPVDGTSSKIGFASALAPNPTKAGFSFRFALRQAGRVHADVFDAGGRKVVNLVDREMAAGTFSASYNGRNLKPGVYWVKLSVPGAQQSRKIVIQQ